MRWVKASDMMPGECDASDGLVVTRWQNELGTRCLDTTDFRRVRPSDEWLIGAWDQEYGTSGPVDRRNRKHHWARVAYDNRKLFCRVWAFGELMDEYPPERTLFLGPNQEWGDTSHLEAPCCVVWYQDIDSALRDYAQMVLREKQEEMRRLNRR